MADSVPRVNSRMADAGVNQWIPQWTSLVSAVERRSAEEASQVREKLRVGTGRVRLWISSTEFELRSNGDMAGPSVVAMGVFFG